MNRGELPPDMRNMPEAEDSPEKMETLADTTASDTRETILDLNKASQVERVIEDAKNDLGAKLKDMGLTDEEVEDRLNEFMARTDNKISNARLAEREVKSDGEKISDAVFNLISTAKEVANKEGFWKKFSKYLKPDRISKFDDVREVYSRVADEGIRKTAYWMGHLREQADNVLFGSYFQAAAGIAISAALLWSADQYHQSHYMQAMKMALASGVLASAEAFVGSVMKLLGTKQAEKLTTRAQNYPKQYKVPDFGKWRFPGVIIHFYDYGKSQFSDSTDTH